MKKNVARPYAVSLFVGIVAILLIADRFTKIMAVEHLSGVTSVPFIPHVLDFYLTYNQGAAFGIFEGGRPFFIILAFLVCIGIFIYLLLNKTHTLFEVIPLAMIGAGALGNAIDRVRVGEVVDFIRTLFIDFPIFNVADSCITVGVIVFILYLFVGFFRKEPEETVIDEEVDDATDRELDDMSAVDELEGSYGDLSADDDNDEGAAEESSEVITSDA